MTKNQAIMASLPMLASVLSAKYGVQVDIGSRTKACTDGNTIYLPELPVVSTDKFITLVRGYIDHESAHCRYTNHSVLSQLNNKVEKFIQNSLEDYRVELLMSQKYAGCEYNFHKLVLEIFGGEVVYDFSYPAMDILNWMLIRLRAWVAPELEPKVKMYEREISSNFSLAILQQILPILEEFKSKVSMLSTDDTITYAKRIAGILKNPPADDVFPQDEEKKKQQKSGNSSSNTGNSPDNTDNSGSSDSKSEAKDKNDEQSESKAQDESSEQGEGNSGKEVPKPDSQTKSNDDFSDLFDENVELPKSFDDSLSDALDKAIMQNRHDNAGKPTRETIGVAYGVQSGNIIPLASIDSKVLSEIERATAALKVRLSGLIQAKTRTGYTPARTGRLNTGALHKVVTCDDKIFLQHSDKQKIDTAVHILLDRSGSMGRDITVASAACHTILLAMQSLNVNVGFTAFPLGIDELAKLNEKHEICVMPIVKHGERVRRKGYSIGTDGSTPTTEALMYVIKTMLPLKEKRKCIFLISDGLPDNATTTKVAVQVAQNFGIEVYGIGLRLQQIHDLIQSSVVINNIQELPEKLFRLMSKILTQ